MSEEGEVIVENKEPSPAETEARQFGWTSQEEWKGDPEDWKDADTFLKRGKEINGFLRKDLEKIQTTLKARNDEIAEIKSAMEDFRKFHNETETRAYQRALNELKAEKVLAIEQGDGSRVIAIDDEIDKIKEAQQTKPEPEKKKPAVDQDKINREYQEWAGQNQWYGKDEVLSRTADEFAEVIKLKSPDLVGKAFLDEVVKKVKNLMPEKFENPNRTNSPVSGNGDVRQSTSKKKTYSDLPPEAKSACDKFVKNKLLTQDQYIREYFGGE